MTAGSPNKIRNLNSLLAEKKRLQMECVNSEKEIEQHFNYIREHAAQITVDHFLIPTIKKIFNLQNLLNVLSIGQLVSTISDKDTKPTLKNLGGIFSKGGILMAARVGLSLLKKFL